MLSVLKDVQLYVSLEPVDMRKSIDGLSLCVIETLEHNPQSGHLYLFRNRQGDKIKILYWDKNGFIVHYKRIERGKFKFPKDPKDGYIEISKEQLAWLLAGLDFVTMNLFPELSFTHYS